MAEPRRGVVPGTEPPSLAGCAAGEFTLVSTRRRGQDLETAILEATLAVVNESGLAALTMEGVAAAAHTGKASVYRRWPSKEDLLVDAMQHALPALGLTPDTGSVREDLLILLRLMVGAVNSRGGCLMQAFLADSATERSLLQVVKARVMEPRLQAMLDILARGVDRGEVRPDAVQPRVGEVASALLVHEYLMHGAPVCDEFVAEVLDQVLMPLLRPSGR